MKGLERTGGEEEQGRGEKRRGGDMRCEERGKERRKGDER